MKNSEHSRAKHFKKPGREKTFIAREFYSGYKHQNPALFIHARKLLQITVSTQLMSDTIHSFQQYI